MRQHRWPRRHRLRGSQFGVDLAGGGSVNNHAAIVGSGGAGISVDAGTATIVNSGAISGAAGVAFGSAAGAAI